MQCPRCHAENRVGRRFCGECGLSLALTCPACGFLNEGTEKFCGGCGAAVTAGSATERAPRSPQSYTPKHLAERIINSKSALEGERKQVTVLFADLKGSMELLADRDPEEARKILDPVLELMMEAVHRYEGTVNQVMGDGIMALFGAPLAHEDHAVRACYAALRMQDSMKRYCEEARRGHGVNVQIRVGINSGEVVVRAIGNDLHMDYTAVGQTTHLAARMEQLASPGSVLLTTSTLHLVEGFIDVKPLGPVPVKGLADAVEIYEATGAGPARTRFQATVRRGLTRFVGRDAELEQLRRAQQLADYGHGQVAAIVGEAGVGKSRLVYEFNHSHRMRGWLVLESASTSYGKATSYLPVIELLKGYFKIQNRDDLREIREKVMGKLLALDESLKPMLPALLALLDAPMDDPSWQTLDPEQRRQRTLDAVRRLLLREAREQPLFLVFEDLHWIDGETQVVLDALVKSLSSARVLLLVNYRPEYQHGWASKTSYSEIRLDALPAESASELLDALLGDDPGIAPLKQLLFRRGNPFFLEESVRTLVEMKALVGERGRYRLTQALQAVQIPVTVQAMLAARIDRLSSEDKRLLHVASVVGKDVPLALLRAVAELSDEALRRGLDNLQAAEFVYETGLYPDLEYSFKHALTHEVAYGTLLQERRRELHARIVDAIETVYANRLGGEIERLAHHAVRGELREKAVHYLRQAGLRASARSALPDARRWFEQALAVLEALPESPVGLEQAVDIRIELRQVLHLLGDDPQVLERLREATALTERLNDERRRGRVDAFMTQIQTLLGKLDEALVTGTHALEIAGRLGDSRLRVLATTYLEQAHYVRGDYERVVELAIGNLAILPAHDVHEYFGNITPISVFDRCSLVMSLTQLGRFAEAALYEGEAIRLAGPTQHAFTVAWAYWVAGMRHLFAGDWARAHALLEQGIAAAQSGNVARGLAAAFASSAWVLAQLGEATQAKHQLRECEELLSSQAVRRIAGGHGVSLPLGRANLLLGRLDEARALAAGASASSHLGGTAHLQHLLGDIATHPDRFDAERGEDHYRQALALAEPRGMRPLIAHCHLGLGKLYHRSGRPAEAQEHLETATTMYREMGMTYWLENAEVKLTT
jgi:class 3 adenylate cyclase/tetratricopeptide (TPR) repeat protein